MKKRIALFLALVLLVSGICASGALAAEEDIPPVRVNGVLVEFPDAQPYINEDERTMIPVRFVAEALGAEVSWTEETETAHIEKDGIRVDITIGDPVLLVTEGGQTRQVIMDTAAVLKDDRTYVPIRFVAEAIGAYVDYSETYNTVQIYSEVLTPEQITMLTSLPYTQPEAAIGYEAAKLRFGTSTVAFLYGTDRESFSVFANAREHLYHMTVGNDLGEYYAEVAPKAVDSLYYESETLSVRFLADSSCIYQADTMDRLTCAVRGIVEVRMYVDPMQLPGNEAAMLYRLGFTYVEKGLLHIPVDVHMNTRSSSPININTISPAGEQF